MSIFLNILFLTLAQSAPYIVIGYFIAALIREYLPMRVMVRNFGQRGIMPLIKSIGIGALLPICSCGSIPLGIGAFRSGAARGTTLSFMISSPAISPVALLLGFSFLGTTLTLSYILIVLIGSFLVGLIGNFLLSGKKEEEFRSKHQYLTPEPVPKPLLVRFGRAMRWAYWDFGSEVSLDLLFGLSLAALVVAFVPFQWITDSIGTQNLRTLFYVILLGIPVYVCAVPGIVIVRNLLLIGMAPGAAIAFLIAGPATNLGTLNAIRHQMGKSTALYYLVAVIFLALLGGLIVDHAVLRNYQYQSSIINGELQIIHCCVPLFGGTQSLSDFQSGLSRISVWHYPFIVILAFTLIFGGVRHIYRIWVNPCSFCQFWREEIEETTCKHKCWFKSVHSWLKK